MFALFVLWMSIVFDFLLEGLFSIFRVIKWSEIEQGMMMPLWLFEVLRILSIVVEELFVILVYLCMIGSRLLSARVSYMREFMSRFMSPMKLISLLLLCFSFMLMISFAKFLYFPLGVCRLWYIFSRLYLLQYFLCHWWYLNQCCNDWVICRCRWPHLLLSLIFCNWLWMIYSFNV